MFVTLLSVVCRDSHHCLRDLYGTDLNKLGVCNGGRAFLIRGSCFVASRLELAVVTTLRVRRSSSSASFSGLCFVFHEQTCS